MRKLILNSVIIIAIIIIIYDIHIKKIRKNDEEIKIQLYDDNYYHDDNYCHDDNI